MAKRRPKPFTRKDWGRLLRVCRRINELLGLGPLGAEYSPSGKDGQTFAYCSTFQSGWRVAIVFQDAFFKQSLDFQLEIIVHEHLHAVLGPYHQAVLMSLQRLVPRRSRKDFERSIDPGLEITIDHVAPSILNLIRPHLKDVL